MRPWLAICWCLLGCGLAACGSYEEQRIRQLMHEKGFGTRASGDATLENYVAGGDAVVFTLDRSVFMLPDHEQLFLLTQPQPVAIDGTILVPYVGPVNVLGKTEAELAAVVENLLRAYFTDPIPLRARVLHPGAKVFFAIGETGIRGPVPLAKADLTLLEAVFRISWTRLANLGRVTLIRPDAEHPLTMVVNLREMMLTGYTAANFAMKEHDIVYIPPTFLGLIARTLERLLSPLGYAVQSLIGIAQARQAYDIATGRDQFGTFFFRF